MTCYKEVSVLNKMHMSRASQGTVVEWNLGMFQCERTGGITFTENSVGLIS